MSISIFITVDWNGKCSIEIEVVELKQRNFKCKWVEVEEWISKWERELLKGPTSLDRNINYRFGFD